MGILVITTGGTIGALPYQDPQHPPEFSSMPSEGCDLVRDVLQTSFSSFATRCIALEPRDSKLIDDAYRKSILTIIETAPEQALLVTHGTDTILNTADFFYRQCGINRALDEKTVVLTGAMTPLANGAESDGYLNLAFSLRWLTDQGQSSFKINIVLCDFDENGVWRPRLYRYLPDRLEKFYDSDGRYNRIRELPEKRAASPAPPLEK